MAATFANGTVRESGSSLRPRASASMTPMAAGMSPVERRDGSPQITSRSPNPGATGVAAGTTVTVQFNETMDASSIDSATFTLSLGGTPVAGSVSYVPATRIATFTPSAPLTAGQTYTARVTTGVKDAVGNALAATDSFNFTIAGTTGQINVGGLSRPVDGIWSGSTSNVHIHLLFTQTGQSLAKGVECPQNDAFCFTQALNAAGAAEIGPDSPGQVFVLLQSVTGTINEAGAITFTITNNNGRTFTFTGTASSPYEMSGTISGPTMPVQSLQLLRPAP